MKCHRGRVPAIDAATCADDVDARKPAPDLVHAALEKAGVGPDQAVYVGDTPWDVQAAPRCRASRSCPPASASTLRAAGRRKAERADARYAVRLSPARAAAGERAAWFPWEPSLRVSPPPRGRTAATTVLASGL
ncbi:HAD family hydrolase [Streptomyces sp. NBC_00829]|nr:HAD family hydrolase [Streptomyces sp. NBC_00829]